MSIRRTRASKRWMVVAAAATLCASTVAVTSSVSAFDPLTDKATRIDGDNRYETAIELNADWIENDCDVVIVNGENFPDGLVASSLREPILLTSANAIHPATKAFLDELTAPGGDCYDAGPDLDIEIVGGPAVVSAAQREALEAYDDNGEVPRYAGADRYATAVAVANEVEPCYVDLGDGYKYTVFLATGQNFADALAGGAYAAYEGCPILLHDGPALSPAMLGWLLDVGDVRPGDPVTQVVILGGTSAVPASVESQLKLGYNMKVTRLSGADRYGTAADIADEMTDGWGNFEPTLVSGENFPDALSAGPWSGDEESEPILLVKQNSLPDGTALFLQQHCNEIEGFTVVGGTSAISDAVVAAAKAAATCGNAAVSSAVMTLTDVKAGEYRIGGDNMGIKAVGAAVGPTANYWQVAFVTAGATQKVEIVMPSASSPYGGATGIPTIVVTAPTSITNLQFQALWNGSAASAYFVASDPLSGTANTQFAPIGGGFDPAPGGVTGPLGATANAVKGTQDVNVTVTFARKVHGPAVNAAPATEGMAPNTLSGLYGNVLGGAADKVAPSPFPTTGGADVITYTWDNVDVTTPTNPFTVISFVSGQVVDAVTLHASGALKVQVTLP